MGIGVSGWRLARAVSLTGQLGVVSGTTLAHVLVRRLESNEPDPALERAIDSFPFPEIALAKTDHDGVVGFNLLEKVALPNLPSLYGAMLAGADYVLMGAGVPRAIPSVLDRLAAHQAATLTIPVIGGGDEPLAFDPGDIVAGAHPSPLRRPYFLAIVSSDVLATVLVRKASGRVDGLVVESPQAGGHNAPPRSAAVDATGQPIYGARDLPDLGRIRALGLPFWLAGAYATAERLAEARRLGAHGVQVETALALCRESGMRDDLKASLLRLSARGDAPLRTDPRASPTGMPFKVVDLPGTLADRGPQVHVVSFADVVDEGAPPERRRVRVGRGLSAHTPQRSNRNATPLRRGDEGTYAGGRRRSVMERPMERRRDGRAARRESAPVLRRRAG